MLRAARSYCLLLDIMLRHGLQADLKINITQRRRNKYNSNEIFKQSEILSEIHSKAYDFFFQYQQILFMCKTSKSIQQKVYQFYQKLVEAEVKTYVLKLHLISIRDSANAGDY